MDLDITGQFDQDRDITFCCEPAKHAWYELPPLLSLGHDGRVYVHGRGYAAPISFCPFCGQSIVIFKEKP